MVRIQTFTLANIWRGIPVGGALMSNPNNQYINYTAVIKNAPTTTGIHDWAVVVVAVVKVVVVVRLGMATTAVCSHSYCNDEQEIEVWGGGYRELVGLIVVCRQKFGVLKGLEPFPDSPSRVLTKCRLQLVDEVVARCDLCAELMISLYILEEEMDDEAIVRAMSVLPSRALPSSASF
eukprot:GHVT01008917.1.p1 GENE.GHVT01008917.1~~GHVT01008917.1.p1  ORF type:complete len:178 (-),score=2.29 GHVT01008917.1:740-1273(-)